MTMKRGTGKRVLPALFVSAVAIVSLALAGCSSGKHKASNAPSSSPAPSSSGSTLSSSAASSVPSGSTGSGAGAASGGSAGSSNPPAASQPANLPQAQIQATAAKNGLSVRLHAGEVIQVVLPPPSQQPGAKTVYTVTPAGSPALAPIAGAPGFYTGVAPGTAKVVVTQTPACPTGSACPAHVVDIGSLTVTVWK